MFDELYNLFPIIVPFALILFRVMGLFVFVPAFSNVAIPMNVKVLLALAMTFCMWNVVPQPATLPATLPGLVVAVAGEMTVGLVIGLLSSLLVAGIQLGAHMLSQQMGLSLATVYDPMFDEQSTVIEQLAFWLAILIFFGIGGHREMVNAVVRSYEQIPMGSGGIEPDYMLKVILGSLQTSFHAAIRVGGPALVAFFLGSLATGFIGRSMPQMNVVQLSITGNLLIGLSMLMIGFAGWAVVSHQSWDNFFGVLRAVLTKSG